MKNSVTIGVVALALAACGSAQVKPSSTVSSVTAPATTNLSMSKAQAGREYLAIVAPINAAIATFDHQVSALSSSVSVSALTPIVTRLAAALQTSNVKLNTLATAYPPAASALHALTGASSSLVGILQSVSGQTVLSISGWVTHVAQTESEVSNDGNIVRSTLGLPPAQS